MILLKKIKHLIKTVSEDPRLFLVLVTSFLLFSVPLTVYVAKTVNDLRSRAFSGNCYDFTGDFKVMGDTGNASTDDVLVILNHYSPPGSSNYNSAYDLNNDGIVSVTDVLIERSHIGEVCTPIINSFTRSPSSIVSGGTSRISWSTSRSTYVEISGIPGTLSPSGFVDVRPTQTTSYTIVAWNSAPSAYRGNTITVTVSQPSPPPPPPTTPTPTANIKANGSNGPITVSSGTRVELTWSSSYVSSCSVNPGGWSGTNYNDDERRYTVNTNTTFTLSCSGSYGSVSDQVQVNVTGSSSPPPTSSPPSSPPSSNPTSSPPPSGSKPPAAKSPAKSGSKSSPPPSGAAAPSTAQPTVSFKVTTGSNSFLVGGKEVILTVEGTNVYKKFLISRSSAEVTVGGNDLIAGNSYTLKLRGDWLLTQKIPFVFSQGMSISLMPLKIGDLNADEKITSSDVFEFLNGFVADKSYDLNRDGVVNSIDYSILVGNVQ